MMRRSGRGRCAVPSRVAGDRGDVRDGYETPRGEPGALFYLPRRETDTAQSSPPNIPKR